MVITYTLWHDIIEIRAYTEYIEIICTGSSIYLNAFFLRQTVNEIFIYVDHIKAYI